MHSRPPSVRPHRCQYDTTHQLAGISCSKGETHETALHILDHTALHAHRHQRCAQRNADKHAHTSSTAIPAVLGLAFGIGLAILMILHTWLSFSSQATARATTFVVHSEEQTFSADELEDPTIPPIFRDDIFRHF